MRSIVAALLCCPLAFSQAAPKPQQPAAPAPTTNAVEKPAEKPAEKPTEVPPNDAFVINGFCPGKQVSDADCKTEVSKTELERLANAVGAPENRRREVANAYAQALVMSTLAKQRGLDNRPDTQDLLRLVQMQALSQVFVKQVREEASNIPQADLDKYYTDHAAQYEQATLERIFIPKMAPNPQEKLDEVAVKAEGAKIFVEAKAPGADFNKLQKEAYADLKITNPPPPTELKDVRRDNLPPAQAKAFDTKEGEVGEPVDDTGGIYIYKVVSKKKLTQPEVESEIKRQLEQERVQAAMQKLVGALKLDYNEAYFGPPERPAPPQAMPPATGKAPATSMPPSTAKPKASTTQKSPAAKSSTPTTPKQ